MKPGDSHPASFDAQTHHKRLGLVVNVLLLFVSTAAAQTEFSYTNDHGRITITKYTGPGGTVIIPDTIDGLPVTHIGDSAFLESGLLTGVVIPNSVTLIGDSAFSSCYDLTNVTIGSGVTNIGGRAFSGCTSLRNFIVPDNVITIGEWAFFSSGVARVSIGDGVTSVGPIAFTFCSGLTTITFGRSITNIGANAFGYCTSLTGVYFKGNAPNLDSYVFEQFDKTIVYYLPETTGWSSTFGGRTTVLWNPRIVTGDAGFGVRAGQFGFNLSGNGDLVIVVEASTDLGNPAWTPVGTNILTGGFSYFSDSHWAENPARFYRLSSP